MNATMGIAAALVAAMTGLAGWGWLQTERLQAAEEKLSQTNALYRGCTARVANLIEDARSDEEAGNMGSGDVPDRWLLPPAGADAD